MKNIIQNKIFTIIVLPLSLFYTIITSYYYWRQHIKIKRAIIENESFFKALMTLGFTRHKYIPSLLYSELDVDENLTAQKIQEIAQKQVISVVLKYLRNEELLQYIKVDTEIDNNKVLFEIKPATLDVAIMNLVNTFWSIFVWTIAAIVIYVTYF